jgi:hypothetical protein
VGSGVKHRALKLLEIKGRGAVSLVSVASDTEAGLRKLILRALGPAASRT